MQLSPTPRARAVDPEVIRAATRYQPALGAMAEHDASRLREITRGAVRGLVPVLVVNRRVDDLLGAFERGADAPLPTIHTTPSLDPATWVRSAYRTANERVRGIHGTGEAAGRTVFGSVRFVGSSDARRGAEAVLEALTQQGAAGVGSYGPLSLVTRLSSVAGRTTIASDDTGVTAAAVAPTTRMSDVVAERLLRGGDGTPAVSDLLGMRTSAARDAVRGWLLSDSLAGAHDYIEAQVRTLRPDETLGLIVDHRASAAATPRRANVDPGAFPDSDAVQVVAQAASRLDLPVHVARDSIAATNANGAPGT